MRIGSILALAIAASFAGGASAMQEPEGLTLLEARTLPDNVLRQRVLGLAGTRYSQIQRPGSDAWPGDFSIRFASSPRSAGFPGLCESDVVAVHFGSRNRTGERIPVSLFYTSTLFEVVAETQPLPDIWNDRYGRRLTRLCDRAGPVLAETNSQPGAGFFATQLEGRSSEGAVYAWFAAHAFNVARRQLADANFPVSCEEDRAEPEASLCQTARATLAALSAGDVQGFSIRRCPLDPTRWCVTATFLRAPSDGFESRILEIRITTDASRIDPPPDSLHVLAISIAAQTLTV